MSLWDLLRGRPSVLRVARIVDLADAAIDDDPAGAIAHLIGLGPRPFFRSPDADRITFGHALRAYAGWRIGDARSALRDAQAVAGFAVTADPILPLVPVLCDGLGEAILDHADILTRRFGGCGQEDCGHAPGLESALAVLAQATDAKEIVRWSLTADSTSHGESIRIGGYGRAQQLDAEPNPDSHLAGTSLRMRRARALVAARGGDHAKVISLLEPDDALAVRSALVLTLSGARVPQANAAAITAAAPADPVVGALLAEAAGDLQAAANAWRGAGMTQRAREAAILAAPRLATGQTIEGISHPGTLWFAHAAGATAAPEAPAAGDIDLHNQRIGARRARLRDLRRSGRIAAEGATGPVKDVRTALEQIRKEPSRATEMLAAARPDASPGALLASLVGAPRTSGAEVGASWRAWADQHSSVTPLPQRVDPLTWLTDRRRYGAPAPQDLTSLSHQKLMPVLAAAVAERVDWATVAAVKALEPASLAMALPQALPDLPALAFAAAGSADLSAQSRRRAAVLAAAALANGVVREAWSLETARKAVRQIVAVTSDLLPDPDELTADEAFDIDTEVLGDLADSTRRRSVGPVLRYLAGLAEPARIPRRHAAVYGETSAKASLLLKVGRPESARRAVAGVTDPDVLADVAIAMIGRHLAVDRPADAWRELLLVADNRRLPKVPVAQLDRLVALLVRDHDSLNLNSLISDAERLLAAFPSSRGLKTLVVEMLLERVAQRPGSAAGDVSDLERAVTLEPRHPMATRSLAFSLVVRAMETVESNPARAVTDVDRATDLYMADAELVAVAAKVAVSACAIQWRRRNVSEASRALSVALSIDPSNRDALVARRAIRGY